MQHRSLFSVIFKSAILRSYKADSHDPNFGSEFFSDLVKLPARKMFLRAETVPVRKTNPKIGSWEAAFTEIQMFPHYTVHTPIILIQSHYKYPEAYWKLVLPNRIAVDVKIVHL